jgi:hypothetical protein
VITISSFLRSFTGEDLRRLLRDTLTGRHESEAPHEAIDLILPEIEEPRPWISFGVALRGTNEDDAPRRVRMPA